MTCHNSSNGRPSGNKALDSEANSDSLTTLCLRLSHDRRAKLDLPSSVTIQPEGRLDRL